MRHWWNDLGASYLSAKWMAVWNVTRQELCFVSGQYVFSYINTIRLLRDLHSYGCRQCSMQYACLDLRSSSWTWDRFISEQTKANTKVLMNKEIFVKLFLCFLNDVWRNMVVRLYSYTTKYIYFPEKKQRSFCATN